MKPKDLTKESPMRQPAGGHRMRPEAARGVVWPILGTTPTGCVGAPTGENTALLRVTEHLRRFGPKG